MQQKTVQEVPCPTLWVSLTPSVAHPPPTHMGRPPSSEKATSHLISITSGDQLDYPGRTLGKMYQKLARSLKFMRPAGLFVFLFPMETLVYVEFYTMTELLLLHLFCLWERDKLHHVWNSTQPSELWLRTYSFLLIQVSKASLSWSFPTAEDTWRTSVFLLFCYVQLYSAEEEK